MKKQQSKRVIPGFGLTMGVTLAMLSIVVLIPLASLAVYSARLGFREFIEVITRPRVLSGFYVSFITAFAATVINAIMGLVLAWVLVRYDFPGKRIMDGMIELPFALPTAVAGISLTSLTSDKGLVGSFFAKFGIKIAYTRIGITVALIFVGIPVIYLFGAVQMKVVTKQPWPAIMVQAVLPFIPLDVVKCFVAAGIAKILRRVVPQF